MCSSPSLLSHLAWHMPFSPSRRLAKLLSFPHTMPTTQYIRWHPSIPLLREGKQPGLMRPQHRAFTRRDRTRPRKTRWCTATLPLNHLSAAEHESRFHGPKLLMHMASSPSGRLALLQMKRVRLLIMLQANDCTFQTPLSLPQTR